MENKNGDLVDNKNSKNHDESLIDKKVNRGQEDKGENHCCDVSARLVALEKLVMREKSCSIDYRNHHENLPIHLATHVDSVVGLRETLTYRRASLKLIWTILLVMGMGATVFYIYRNISDYLESKSATRITVDQLPSYGYPPLVFCPPWWLDVDDLAQKGLPLETIQYSFGFSDILWQSYVLQQQNLTLKNLSIANASFFEFYKKNQFQSFGDYLKYIASDLLDETSSDYFNASLSVLCTDCDFVNESKQIFFEQMCYKIQLRNATQAANAGSPAIYLTNNYFGEGIFNQTYTDWQFDVLSNILSHELTFTLKSGFKYSGKLSVQRNVMLQNCNSTEGYTQRSCIIECQYNSSPTITKVLVTWPEINPENANNNFINVVGDDGDNDSNGTNITYFDDSVCYEKCLPLCDRMIYDISFQEKTPEPCGSNRSCVKFELKHAALFHGGIITWQEVETTTFADFMSNVGGTLGLFLGCTVMTIAQFILSLMDFALERKNGNNSIYANKKHG